MIRIIFNPKAARGIGAEKFKKFLNRLQAEKILYANYKTERKGHGKSLARELSKTKEPIIVAGGDGSIYDVINGMDMNIPISIIPLGTGNDVAKTLGIKFNIEKNIEALKKQPKLIDYATINEKYRSLSFISYGIATDMVRAMASFANNNKANYFFAMVNMLFSFNAKTYELEFNGEKKIVTADFLSIHNCIYAGGGMYLGHNASVTDGFLDLLIVEYKGKFRRIMNAISILRKNLHNQPNASMYRISNMKIVSKNDKYCCVDGEIIQETAINIKVVPGGLKILY
ncbi:MAG: YegS/Rv2252/BmrU family lipid kinase [Defluviitaleaceae bacterium]|nr:YegS/Rv2252/BmrU family lipid kinase [Defluviitaleaceae bacterium]